MIIVKEIMKTDLFVMNRLDTLYQARLEMDKRQIRHILVVDDDEELVGLLTQRDLFAAAVSIFADVDDETRDELEKSIPLMNVMTSDIVGVDADTNLVEAAQYLIDYKRGCLPVLSNGRLVGIITESDFVILARDMLDKMR